MAAKKPHARLQQTRGRRVPQSDATGERSRGIHIMTPSGESEEKVLLPPQDIQQQWNLQALSQPGLAARVHPLPADVLGLPADVLGKEPGKCAAASTRAKTGLDDARFSAGIVEFYEAVLKEPVPEKMLRLVGEIAKRERGA
jgi:hypothetical protein